MFNICTVLIKLYDRYQVTCKVINCIYLYVIICLFLKFQSTVKQGTNTALFDPERRLAVLLSYRLTVFHNKLNTLSLTILGTLAEVSKKKKKNVLS